MKNISVKLPHYKASTAQPMRVSDKDYGLLSGYRWYLLKNESGGRYAFTRIKDTGGRYKTVQAHRMIINAPDGFEIDHRDGNGLNNQRENLRIATHSQNQCNTGKFRNNTSGYKGVVWYPRYKKWMAQIQKNKKRINLGYFNSPKEASLAYQAAAEKLHGEFANKV